MIELIVACIMGIIIVSIFTVVYIYIINGEHDNKNSIYMANGVIYPDKPKGDRPPSPKGHKPIKDK